MSLGSQPRPVMPGGPVPDLELVIVVAVTGCPSRVGGQGHRRRALSERLMRTLFVFRGRCVGWFETRCRTLGIRGTASVGCIFEMPEPILANLLPYDIYVFI